MFDLFEHLTTTLRRTFAIDDQGSPPAAPATPPLPLAPLGAPAPVSESALGPSGLEPATMAPRGAEPQALAADGAAPLPEAPPLGEPLPVPEAVGEAVPLPGAVPPVGGGLPLAPLAPLGADPSKPSPAPLAVPLPKWPAVSLGGTPRERQPPPGGRTVFVPPSAAGLDAPQGVPAEPVVIPLDPETLAPMLPDAGDAAAAAVLAEARAAEPLPLPPRQSAPRHPGQPDAGHASGGRLRALGQRPLRTVVVIPAYNEEQTLPEVIVAAKAVPEVSEVIVVSDGSTDATAAVARKHGAICIELRQNVGKGGAMKVGIDRADADVFVFLDADLIGVTPVHIQAMIHPVLRGDAAVSIAQLEGGRVATDLASVVAPNLSGQRAVTRAVLQGMSGMETTRFGVEIAMKRYIKRNHIPVVRVPLDISHRTKEEKLGLLRGFLARLKEYWEIVKVAGE